MNKLKKKDKKKLLTVQIFFNLQNPPTFRSVERLVNFERGGECFVGLSILIVYGAVNGSNIFYKSVFITLFYTAFIKMDFFIRT